MKEKLFSVTSNDCEFTPYRGSGSGGQNKNKTYSAIRCVHKESGAVGECENHREQHLNKREAFLRMSKTKEFKKWMRIATARATGELLEIEKRVDSEIKKVKVEVKDKKGRWTEECKECVKLDLVCAGSNIEKCSGFLSAPEE